MPKYDFLLIGAALVDILAETGPMKKVVLPGKYVENRIYLSLASKTMLKSMKLSPGGSAMNVAVILDFMGSECALLTCLGKGVFGDYVLERIKKARIAACYVKRAGTRTGVGINLISGGEKSSLVYHGAVDELGPNDITGDIVKNSKHILITSVTSKKNYALFLKTLKLAKKHDVPVIFAPSMTMLKEFKGKLAKLKYKFDIVILNYEEGSFLTHKKDVKQIMKSLPGNVVVITKDKQGAYAKSGKEVLHVSSLPVKVKNTTGAGDVFCGAFVHSYYKTNSLSEALRMATGAASIKLSRIEPEIQCSAGQIRKFLGLYKKQLRVRTI